MAADGEGADEGCFVGKTETTTTPDHRCGHRRCRCSVSGRLHSSRGHRPCGAGRTSMPGSPIANNGRAPTKAEGQEVSPKLGSVAASLAPTAPKEGLERIENAVARWLRPGWCLSQPEPPWTVLRSTPSSAEMRVIVAPTSRSRAASSYSACRRRRDAALASWAAVGIGVDGISNMMGGT
jgi:hypothetical protein